ncbi:MAG: radical SAM protein [Spirochaetaceae bacterium]|jgi:anaerobic magnesium-protoporphyrin IX monomethyl ester cyclase|nr:radical SAM protein [Spirochaetaceae bacterium]
MGTSLNNFIYTEGLKILFMRSGGHFIDTDFPDAPMIAPPKGLLQLAGLFKDDPQVETGLLDVLAYPDFKSLKKDKKNPPFYFGMKDQEILKRVGEYNPHIIAVTSTANYYINDTIKMINLLRKSFPNCFIVVGGPDATNDYEDYYTKTQSMDLIVLREGEETFKELVTLLMQGKDWQKIQGIVYQEDGALVKTEERPYVQNLDDYPCDYSIADFESYYHLTKIGYPSRLNFKYPGSYKSIDMVTSRGCSYNCSFCCIHLHMGKKTRLRSVENVLAEMEELVKVYGVRNFHFEDDNLLFDLERFKNILRGIIARGWNITWDTPNGVRADLVDQELMELCRASGCTYLVFGIESGSKKIIDTVINKKISLEDYIRACRLCWENEIDTMAFFIFGMPGETKEDLLKTYYFAFDLFKKYNTTPIFQLWRPYRNTDMELGLRDSSNIGEPVLYSVFKEYRIPYTLFYSRVYEDEEITLEFIAYYFEKYLKDSVKVAFRNWLKVAQRRPLMYFTTLFQVLGIFISSIFNPSRSRKRLQLYLSSSGLLPFAQMHKMGRKKPH